MSLGWKRVCVFLLKAVACMVFLLYVVPRLVLVFERWEDWVLNRLLPGVSSFGALKRIPESIRRLAERQATSRDAFNGRWTGELRTYEGIVPIRLTIEPQGAWLQIAHGSETAGTGILTMPDRVVRITGDTLVASFDTSIPTNDSARVEHWATRKLTLRGERLSGPVYAESNGFYFWLPSYACLRREQGAGQTQAE